MKDERVEISVIVPTYNERANLEPLVKRICAAIDDARLRNSVSRETIEILFIDDNSPDGTAAEAERLGTDYSVRVHKRVDERGLATAVICGIRRARGEIVVVMDADLSHPPETLPDLVAALCDPGVDAAVGSRFVPGGRVDLYWPLHRRLNSWIGRMLARPLTDVRDMMAGFFAFRRREVDVDALRPVGYKILLEMLVRCGWRNVVEIPITFADRAHGKSKLSVVEQMRYLRHLWRLYTSRLRKAH